MGKIIIFDWDGTIHNTKCLYGNAFREAYSFLVKNGYAPFRNYNDDETAVYLGMNAVDMWNTFMPDLDPEIKNKASQIIGEEMVNQVKQHKAILYDKALDVLSKLKRDGHILVFLSNCKRAYMNAFREEFMLDRFFDSYFCCEDYAFAPKENIFLDIANFYGYDAMDKNANLSSKFIVVGDRQHDIAVAKKYDLYSVGCGYGFGAEGELDFADIIIDNLEKLCLIDYLK